MLLSKEATLSELSEKIEDKRDEIPNEHLDDVVELALMSNQELVANMIQELARQTELDVEIHGVKDSE